MPRARMQAKAIKDFFMRIVMFYNLFQDVAIDKYNKNPLLFVEMTAK